MIKIAKITACALFVSAFTAVIASPAFAGAIRFASTAGNLNTNSGNWTPMTGLAFALPPASSGSTVAIVTLNVPNPYAQGGNFPGGQFAISVNNAVLLPIAVFTYNEKVPPSTGRMPTTLVVKIQLTANTQVVRAVWQGVRGSNVIIDTPASLSAVIE